MLDVRDHVSRIVSVAGGGALDRTVPHAPQEPRAMTRSWQRCLDDYGFDPGQKLRIDAVSDAELKRQRQAADELLHFSRDEIDTAFAAVSLAGFSISVANAAGHVLAERSNYHCDYYSEVERPGTLWTEAAAGTNGIGTCLVERRPVAVLTNDHFFYEFAPLSCAVAPVYGADAEIVGAINLGIRNPSLHADTLRVVFGLTLSIADRLGERLFRNAHRRNHILRLSLEPGKTALIAVDRGFQIVGLNHAACELLQESARRTRQRSLWSVFERDPRLVDLDRLSGSEFNLRLSSASEPVSVSLIAPTERPAARPATPNAGRTADAAGTATASGQLSLDACAGADGRMAANVRFARRLIGGGLPLLLLGETGVGKDAFAQAIHLESPRRSAPFVAFNCAAVPETLIDSELFGYGSGAFTGARREGSAGRLVEADGGTLFLDEIGDMPLVQQTRLLRVLESGDVTPLGSGKPRRVDIQVIAATNQDLEARMDAGQFRRDLYYRLAGGVIDIPPLRERSDFDDLVAGLMSRLAGGRPFVLDPAAVERLAAHAWPGNIRELRHVLARAVQICDGGVVTADDLRLRVVPRRAPAAAPSADAGPASDDRRPNDERTDTARGAAAAAEREVIAATLARCSGSVRLAAEALNVSRATLYRKLRRYGFVS